MTTFSDRRAADIALTVGAVLGSLCLIATALAVITGLRPVIFETGSMSPAIGTGSLGLSRTVPAVDVHRGDVVGVTRPDGTRVTHRVESVDGTLGDSVTLTLKGDGNTVTDARPYAVTEVDRVYATVPGLGYVAMWLKNPYTIALEALVLLGLLAVAFSPGDGWRATSTGRRILIGTAAATVATVAVTGAVTPGRSDAALTAQAHATGSVQTGRPANAAWLRCNDTGGLLGLGSSVTMTWPNPTGTPTGLTYVLTVQGPNATPQEHTYPAATAGNPVVVNAANLGLLSWLVALLGNIVGGGQVTVSFTLTTKVGNFTSATSLTQLVTLKGTGLLGLVPALTCNTGGDEGVVSTPQNRLTTVSPTHQLSIAQNPSSSATSSSAVTPAPAPSEASPSEPEPAPSEASPSEAAPTQTPTATPQAPPLPPGGVSTDSGAFAYYRDGDDLTIRDTATATVVYRYTVPADCSVHWQSGTEQLVVTAPDGTVTTISRIDQSWREVVVAPSLDADTSAQATERPAASGPSTGTDTDVDP